jgi:hypothetical protein
MTTGSEMTHEERMRQIEVEGWTPEHDDTQVHGEMAKAAMSYVDFACRLGGRFHDHIIANKQFYRPEFWLWDDELWKPSDDPIRNLQKAGALIAAEIDRLLRLRSDVDERYWEWVEKMMSLSDALECSDD